MAGLLKSNSLLHALRRSWPSNMASALYQRIWRTSSLGAAHHNSIMNEASLVNKLQQECNIQGTSTRKSCHASDGPLSGVSRCLLFVRQPLMSTVSLCMGLARSQSEPCSLIEMFF